ncbi:STAS/SEC14 domain-containing protein [Mycobacterium sp. Y57]|uniref:STAS/SEC14 domain-containing protein n=1 Tax=Mycolicibacterium xanthum TaxID=2796469 RepID=UPI001C847972|nr:STAS/SEC14 domain-containing protein [Mycolicibacterium xanthum]MBX7435090.1 STAS/SEC14 domain-containing protein [Mycolicibacterium xanthum]
MIEVLEDFPDNVAAFVCRGRVTRADYESVLIPRCLERLEHHHKVRVYYEVAAEFDGIDPGAAWEDAKLGLGHLPGWERFVVVTDVEWMQHAVKFFGFLMPGELTVFPSARAEQARAWIVGDM